MSHPRKKIPVGILGATGMVGQKFIELLADHPWFEITSLAASEHSTGKRYCDAASWRNVSPLPPSLAEKTLDPCEPILPCKILFSGLGGNVAKEIESNFAAAGYAVISNSHSHRMDPQVPLLIPEVNGAHLGLIKHQKFGKGMIVTNPNCSVIGLAMALKPLVSTWGVDTAHVVTMQAISGAGYPGVASWDILDNIVPFISGEESKVEAEPLKILGSISEDHIAPYHMAISAQCNRVPVIDGHMASVSVQLNGTPDAEEIIESWRKFQGEPQQLQLPTAPAYPLIYLEEDKHPQPKLHRLLGKGMAVSIGRLRKCPILGWKFSLLSHNTIRGAAGCAILNAELMLKKGYLSYE